MRKLMLAAIMAASALVPAAAFAQNEEHGRGGGWRQHDNGGGQGRQQAQPQQQAQPRFERPQGQPEARHFDRGQAQIQAQPQQQPRGDWAGRSGGWAGRPQLQQQPVITPPVQQQAQQGGRGDWRGTGGQQGGRGDWRGTGGQRGDWRGNDGRQRADNRGGGNWNRGWRNDSRYDWGRARQHNRDNFHLPRYYAPYGWNYGYRRFSIGFRLSSILFEQNYWIDDPYYYDLPPAYGPYRWVRYYNDALLVDIYTGEVVDTVYDIFW